MAHYTLQHCTPVRIDGPHPQPQPVSLNLLIGGIAGEGLVEISGAPGELPVPIIAPCGGPFPCHLPGVTEVWVHYRKSPLGPPEIDLDVIAPPPVPPLLGS